MGPLDLFFHLSGFVAPAVVRRPPGRAGRAPRPAAPAGGRALVGPGRRPFTGRHRRACCWALALRGGRQDDHLCCFSARRGKFAMALQPGLARLSRDNSPMSTTHSQSITPQLRQWIVEQAQAGHGAEAVLKSMLASGWNEDVAVEAMETTLRGHLEEQAVQQGLPPGGGCPGAEARRIAPVPGRGRPPGVRAAGHGGSSRGRFRGPAVRRRNARR